jgi:hypothetical protein
MKQDKEGQIHESVFYLQDFLFNNHVLIFGNFLRLKYLILMKKHPELILLQIDAIILDLKKVMNSLEIFKENESNVVTVLSSNLKLIENELKDLQNLYIVQTNPNFKKLAAMCKFDPCSKLKSIMIFFVNDFLTWCADHNSMSLQFKKTSDNMIAYCEFIRKHYKDQQLLNAISSMESVTKKIGKNNIDIMRTLRMTCHEI